MHRDSLGGKKLAVQEELEGQSGWSVGSGRGSVQGFDWVSRSRVHTCWEEGWVWSKQAFAGASGVTWMGSNRDNGMGDQDWPWPWERQRPRGRRHLGGLCGS